MSDKINSYKRVISVCNACKAQKLKCDRARPSCSRCLRVGRQCIYGVSSKRNNTLLASAADSLVSHLSSVSRNSVSPDFLEETHSMSSNSSPLLPHEYSQNNLNNTLTLLPNITMDIWDPNTLIISHGFATYYDLPFGIHCLCHIGNDKTPTLGGNCGLFTNTGGELKGPLSFLEKPLMKWIEENNEYVKNQLPLDYFNTIYTVGEIMHPNLLLTIETLLSEIEIIMINKEQVDFYLRNFYENIYPFYPLIDIPLFEKQLKDILIDTSGRYYKFNVLDRTVRNKIETLTTFVLIISISIRSCLDNKDQLFSGKKNESDTATNLIIFAQKLLSLLNGFKYTNENVLCCSLLLFIAEFLSPNNRQVHSSHDDILTLDCITRLAITLGLYNDPIVYERYRNNPNYDNSSEIFKRKLWITLQTIRFQILTVDGGFDEMDLKYLHKFKNVRKSGYSLFEDRFKESSFFDYKLFTMYDAVYDFHKLLGGSMISISPMNETQNLSQILDCVVSAENFMNDKFSLESMEEFPAGEGGIMEDSWRHASLNILAVRNFNRLNMNIMGLSSILGIQSKLVMYFEKLCKDDNGCLNRLAQLYPLTIVLSEQLEEKYIGVYQALQVVRYLSYLIENESLIAFVNKFWKMIFNSSRIAESVTEKINSKWGIGPKSVDIIQSYLENPSVLNNIDLTVIKEITKIIDESNLKLNNSQTHERNWENLDKFDISLFNDEMFSQFVQSNFEFF
ncbi:hypothetical protein C6P44_000781 [Monosporozyma unispora]|nr:hypothetical protein C6P44_000781 [Kazachstania unispora]